MIPHHFTRSLFLFCIFLVNLLNIESQNMAAQVVHEWNSFYSANGKRIDAQVISDYSGNVYVAGTTIDSLGNTNWLILKFDLRGELLWHQTYYGGVNGANHVNAIALDESANLIAAGSVATASNGDDYLIRKYDHDGEVHLVKDPKWNWRRR